MLYIIELSRFSYPIEEGTISFDDYDGDNNEELILFTRKGNSLFLSIIDLKSSQYILHEAFVMKRSPINHHREWDFVLKNSKFIRTDKNKIELVFALNSCLSFFPRGIYLYDIEEKTISKKFENFADKTNILLHDINKDGYDEIIVSGNASGRGSTKSKYSDQNNWLFVLDKKLDLVFEPKLQSSYPSSYCALPFTHLNENYILSCRLGNMNTNDWCGLIVLDASGNKLKQLTTNSFGKIHVKKIEILEKVYFLLATSFGELKIFDFDFQLLNSQKLSNLPINILDMIDIENDGNMEYLFNDNNSIIVTNSNFEVIAKHYLENKISKSEFNKISYNKSETKTLTISLSGRNYYDSLSFKTTLIYQLLYGMFFISFLLILTIGYFLDRMIQRINRSIFIQNYHINKTNSAIMLISDTGKIKSFNKNVQPLLGIDRLLQRNHNFKEILNQNKTILSILDNSIVESNFELIDVKFLVNNEQRIGTLNIIPLKSIWGYIYAYLIEYIDFTNPIISDRQKVWSKTSQKIAHDIKTPLSTIQLNLAALSKRIDDEEISAKEGFRDDISMIRSEVNRIRSLTKGFLKFTNLEKPNLQIVSIKEIFNKSLQQFHSYTENGVKIATSFSENEDAIYVDPLQIEQLFHIIIENSIDSMDGKGSIDIKTELAQKMNSEEFIQIEFSDNGRGIEHEKVNEIFEPYFTTKKDGTGLGLTIAKKIVEDNNGEIKLYSKLDLGTTVTILLPIAIEETT